MKARWKLRRELPHGARIPRGWRMAWYLPRRRVGVYYPRPLHRVLRVAREVFHRLRMALRAPNVEGLQVFAMQRAYQDRQRLADEYARGYMEGWRECFRACLAAVDEELAISGDVWEIGALLTGAPPTQKDN
jgi:hypothetical protein